MSAFGWKLKWCLASIILAASSIASAQTTFTAASCSSADFMTQINASANGDTVQGPLAGGSAAWSGAGAVTISSSHQITLNGNGCVIAASDDALDVTAGTSNSSVVTGFTFNFTSPGLGVYIRTLEGDITCRFYNNSVTDNGTSSPGTILTVGQATLAQLAGPCLVDHNTFTTNESAEEVVHNFGCSDPQNATCRSITWSRDIVPGGNNGDCVFFENNKFVELSGGGSVSAIENRVGPCVVWRDNQLQNSQFDAHGDGGPGACTGHSENNTTDTRWWEVYNNHHLSGQVGRYLQIRGGSGVYFGNFSDQLTGATAELTDDCTSGTWPITQQVGRGINGTTSSPAYIWNEQSAGGLNLQIYTWPSFSMSGSPMVQMGNAVSGDTTDCPGSPAVSHPAGVCDVVQTTSQPSTLTRCESAADQAAGCPVSYTYTPYTYPHPLDNCPTSSVGTVPTSSCTTGPAPPTNLTATPQAGEL